jgi:hypothetical protein
MEPTGASANTMAIIMYAGVILMWSSKISRCHIRERLNLQENIDRPIAQHDFQELH